MWSADVAALSVDGWQPNEDAVVMRSQGLLPVYRQILWSSAVLASAHRHTQFVLDALRHVKPMKVGAGCVVVDEDGESTLH